MHLFSRTLRPAALPCLTAILLTACADRLTAPVTRPTAPLGVSAAVVMPAFTGNIRIGVIPAATSVSVGSDAAWELRNQRTNAVLFSGESGAASVALESGSVSTTNWRLQIACTSSLTDRDARLALAESRGYVTYTVFFTTGNCWRVMIGAYPASMTFGQRTAERNRIAALGHAPADAFFQSVTITTGVTRYKITRGTDIVFSDDPVFLKSSSGLVHIGTLRYRGIAHVVRNASGSLAGVNELPLEHYLYGVVPRELPPGPWPQPEAQKAQAVAARTYALRGVGKRIDHGYDLLATTTDQVYGGYDAEHLVSSTAVDATEGIVATFIDKDNKEKLIDALFSSTTGGWTANSEEVFADTISYLRSVPDAQRGQALEHVPSLEVFRNHGNPRSLRAEHNGSAEAQWSSRHRWTFEWTAEEISEVISTAFATPVGAVQEINVLERGPSGRVIEIEFVTEAGKFYRKKDAIRSTLKYIDAFGNPQSLYSTLFFIEPVVDKKTQELGFRVFGGGWGHGVGLGQTGAAGMADKGASFDEILKHYYRGIELKDYRTAD